MAVFTQDQLEAIAGALGDTSAGRAMSAAHDETAH